ncbi:hypothetical protein FN846DRAFT_977517 [Sphaerosporella brunnea]|uniref:Uncharacterized protein n=1 Tax=Sphaerosporella brunnea TaxID=1250544 RepID=A0A5J5EEV9_9PEZI|nr:hypothetical protein FN846DRAFT_977517 [Sphaerosporella brunnea]
MMQPRNDAKFRFLMLFAVCLLFVRGARVTLMLMWMLQINACVFGLRSLRMCRGTTGRAGWSTCNSMDFLKVV